VFLTFREEYRMRVFKNRMLKRILGPIKEEMVRGCRKLHNKELHNLYSSPNIVKMIKAVENSFVSMDV
jgi:ribosomal protein L10